MKTSKYKFIIMPMLLLLSIIILFSCKKQEEAISQVFGVWWWNSNLDERYLEFAKNNNINEIYFCDDELDQTSVNFTRKANDFNIDVYWLTGDYRWLHDFQSAHNEVDRFIEYNHKNPNLCYKGIHFDIEPHQDPNFGQAETRKTLIYNLIDLAYNLSILYPAIQFDYDLPFWLDDIITFNNVAKPVYQHMIDIADRIFLMSYRDSAEDMLEVSKEELDYAKTVGKTVVLGGETSFSEEGDNITYYEEGKVYLNSQINLLFQALPQSSGVSIHHIKSWYDLKE